MPTRRKSVFGHFLGISFFPRISEIPRNKFDEENKDFLILMYYLDDPKNRSITEGNAGRQNYLKKCASPNFASNINRI